jgi:hypothetical protein
MFGTVVNMNPSLLQTILIVGRFICILESSPAANIVNQHGSPNISGASEPTAPLKAKGETNLGDGTAAG